jgi:hypothetical protein
MPVGLTRECLAAIENNRPRHLPHRRVPRYKASMDIKLFLKEFDIELDDVRWYLARETALRLLEYRENMGDLCQLIWSGRLEADLYSMEERYLEELQERLDTRRADESEIRKIIGEINASKSER